jgi:glycolate oxidase
VALSTAVRTAFEEALAPDDVIADPVRCRAYECDGLTGYRVVPELVLLPRDAAQVAAAVRVCARHRCRSSPVVRAPASPVVRCPSRTEW